MLKITKIGIIGGSGLDNPDIIEDAKETIEEIVYLAKIAIELISFHFLFI